MSSHLSQPDEIQPRTPGEQSAYTAGVAAALNDVDKHGLKRAVELWRPLLELELERMEQQERAQSGRSDESESDG
jgi:hypothetical protein